MRPLTLFRLGLLVALGLATSSCVNMGGFDLTPKYNADKLVVPAKWDGTSPFVQAQPSDAIVRKQWWKLFNDPVLDELEAHAMASNPDLQAAAERFLQARDEMMKARSKLIPKIGANVEAGMGRESENAPYRSPDSPIRDADVLVGGMASWEPDIWSRLRNATKVRIYRAEQMAAVYALAKLSIQAELAAHYFALRGLDAQDAIYRHSIEYYEKSLNLVLIKYRGLIAAELDVVRAQYQLSSTQARHLSIQGKRQVAEHAIAVLVNRAPASFRVEPVEGFSVPHFEVPSVVPSVLVQRRPDVAAAEREMAQANRSIGIARAAFFPNVPIGGNIGVQGLANLFRLPNFFWSIGAFLRVPAFEGGYRRAALQQAWSGYREMEDQYRATVLNAFREVEDGLSRTRLISAESERQEEAVSAAWKQQDLSMELYRGGLASSLELINAQVNTLNSRIRAVEVRAELLCSTVGLVRSLGGGWQRGELPGDDEIQPFGVFQYTHLSKPEPVGGIDVELDQDAVHNNVAQTAVFAAPSAPPARAEGKPVDLLK